jgi:hypothetical protein
LVNQEKTKPNEPNTNPIQICKIFPKANKDEAGALSDRIYATIEKTANDSEIMTK